MAAEHTTHLDVELERDIAAAGTVSIRAFRQNVDDQLVTMFGVEMPGRPAAELGHYFMTNSGDVKTNGWSAGLRTSGLGPGAQGLKPAASPLTRFASPR